MRVADYPTIQDYVGAGRDGDERVADVRLLRRAGVRRARRTTTRSSLEPGVLARGNFLHWAWQIKFVAAQNVAHVVDKMLHACGGSGYKRDMELERYLRDAKAGWVMGPTNEVLRQFVGKAVLLGFESLDYWNQTLQPACRRERGQEARLARQARARRAAARRGRRGRRPRSRRRPGRAGGHRDADRGCSSRVSCRETRDAETYRVAARRRRRRSRCEPGRPAHGARRRTAASGPRLRRRSPAHARGSPRALRARPSPPGAEETFRAERDGRRRGRRAPAGRAGGRGRRARLRPPARDPRARSRARRRSSPSSRIRSPSRGSTSRSPAPRRSPTR